MPQFGTFQYICSNVPSYPACNLFYRQLQHTASDLLTGVSADSSTAPVGVNPHCGIPRAGHEKSLGNIVNLLVCFFSIVFVVVLVHRTNRRKNAVGRSEFRTFLVVYLLTLIFQVFTTGSYLRQGSDGLTVLTAIHLGLIVSLFTALLASAIPAIQVVLAVEERTWSFLVTSLGSGFLMVLVGVVAGYIALDVGFGFSDSLTSKPPGALRSVPLFFFICVWPLITVAVYLCTMLYIALWVLMEGKPLRYFGISFALFGCSQVAYFLVNESLCIAASGRLDGSFISTILETSSVGVLFMAWRSITEGWIHAFSIP
ncbi:hypothetical protein BDN72DRAFT_823786 [Pluteus cervinus]|uniref:Uncharacterized protein n=1 Tax=Pluteus cervinus TaxID=181527 RepID=A0ACD3AKF5_9AGAR|nr:hypothetical protein BDN72DRAFT_823786 [Pluteus cervinus]